MRDAALAYLYRELRSARIALGHAEYRQGVTQEELDRIQHRIDVLEWLTGIVLEVEE